MPFGGRPPQQNDNIGYLTPTPTPTPPIRDHTIRVTPHSFDDFAASGVDALRNQMVFGLA
ncbi:MAG: hypothetical protein ABIO85_06055 [Sphingomicrobium sp.]